MFDRKKLAGTATRRKKWQDEELAPSLRKSPPRLDRFSTVSDEEIVERFTSWRHTMSHGSAIIRKSLFDEIGRIDARRLGQQVGAQFGYGLAWTMFFGFPLLAPSQHAEREAVAASERPIIASVFLNRIKKKMFLQSDSTAQYALGYQAATKQWWKSPVTIEELTAVKSLYNTYLNAGLPPGPIANRRST